MILRKDAWLWSLLLLALLTAANAVWMLAEPQHWYHDLPGVYLPALLTVPLAFLALRAARLRAI